MVLLCIREGGGEGAHFSLYFYYVTTVFAHTRTHMYVTGRDITCLQSEYKCGNGSRPQCVAKSAWCDGSLDCDNEADELFCGKQHEGKLANIITVV